MTHGADFEAVRDIDNLALVIERIGKSWHPGQRLNSDNVKAMLSVIAEVKALRAASGAVEEEEQLKMKRLKSVGQPISREGALLLIDMLRHERDELKSRIAALEAGSAQIGTGPDDYGTDASSLRPETKE